MLARTIKGVNRRLTHCSSSNKYTKIVRWNTYQPISGSDWHVSVLGHQVLEFIDPLRKDAVIVDATFGGGGHSFSILDKFPDCKLYGFDRDETVFELNKTKIDSYEGRCIPIHSPFSKMSDFFEEKYKVDCILMDIGVSSLQLDTSHRGFSFRAEKDGPLDMRMDQSDQSLITAAEIINTYPEKKLADLLYEYGEERKSRPIAKAICDERKLVKIETTNHLGRVIRKVARKTTNIDPCTKTFQALRIEVNDELGELKQGLESAIELLRPGGKLMVITFHSLEAKLVKKFFQTKAKEHILVNQKQYLPTEEEIEFNKRARSAKLKCAIRTANK
eukprot:TRINITY_DN11609_c0_g1_i1.p1 TRINITY_DN11609_c0_g1~~TRINITY_DN11609_c0_g1_i1.p1  ORF type:complete len:332 (-),score=78.99 TRINITY_DN11609_c0_g1_i1:163-1158(-)